MTMRPLWALLAPALLLTGCNHCCKNKCHSPGGVFVPRQRLQPGYLPPSPVTPLQSTPVAPGPVGPGSPITSPPGPVGPGAPIPIPSGPASPGPVGPGSPTPAPAPGGVSGYLPEPSPPVDSRWQPVPGSGVRLAPPEAPSRDNVRLQPPAVTEAPPRAGIAEQRESSPALPVGIPQFAIAREGVSSGLTPQADGIDWLRANGYRTVLHLHPAGVDDGSARKAVESRGMTFLSLTVSPESLAQAAEEFNRIVNHKPNQPVFVYDKDGIRAGSLWYLYFRVVDRLADDAARRKATDLGLRETTQGEAGTMWVAIQQHLRSAK